MIFVIRFLLFVARPRRSGPFLRSPGVIVVRERPVGGGSKRRKIRRKGGRSHRRCAVRAALLAERVGYDPGGRIERRRTAPGFARARDCASVREMKSGGQGGATGQPDRGRLDRGGGRAGSGAFGWAADLRRRLVLA